MCAVLPHVINFWTVFSCAAFFLTHCFVRPCMSDTFCFFQISVSHALMSQKKFIQIDFNFESLPVDKLVSRLKVNRELMSSDVPLE